MQLDRTRLNRTRRIPGAVHVGVVLALVLAVPGCSALDGSPAGPRQPGGDAASVPSFSPDALAAKALADLYAARTVHLKGKGGDATVDLRLVPGQGCEGTLGEAGKGTLRMIVIGRKVWFMPDSTFWSSWGVAASTHARFDGKYISATTSTRKIGYISTFCDLKTLTDDFGLSATGLTRGGRTTVDGVSAVTLQEPDSSRLYVTDSATPRLVRVDRSAEGGDLTDFLDYDRPVTLAAPDPALTVSGSPYWD